MQGRVVIHELQIPWLKMHAKHQFRTPDQLVKIVHSLVFLAAQLGRSFKLLRIHDAITIPHAKHATVLYRETPVPHTIDPAVVRDLRSFVRAATEASPDDPGG